MRVLARSKCHFVSILDYLLLDYRDIWIYPNERTTAWALMPTTVFNLISEHTLISGHPPILCWWRLLPEHVEIYVYWLCYCVASCNRYLMLIYHPTDGATRGLTLRVRLLGRILKKDNIFFFFLAKKFVRRTVR